MPPEVTLEPGTVLLGKYRIERVLGRGGMGVVVLAKHAELDEPFAIKVLTGELDDDGRARFVREARAAARINSDHVARVVDVGTLPEGVPYMVIKFLEGTDLAGLIDDRGALPVPEAVELILEACLGLTEAHARGFVHRDLKPANLFVQTTSTGRRVKLLDFGISKATRDVALTSTRAVLGTPAYMAPEQWRSAKDADERSDIWSIGVVLHELLSGARPFRGDSVPEMCAAVLAEDPPPLALGLPALERVVARCLAKEPEARYQRIPELARDLVAFAADPAAAGALVDRMDRIAGRPSSPSVPAPTAVERPLDPGTAPTVASAPRRTLAIALGLGAVAVVAAAGTYLATRSPASVEDPAGPATPAAGPVRGGTLRVGISRADDTRIALYAGQPTRTQAALRMVLERLVVLDAAGQLQPSVLAGVEARDDGKTLVLAVRPGVRFHDAPCAPSAEATGADLEFSIREAIAQHQLDFDVVSMQSRAGELVIALRTPVVSYAHALSHVWLVPAALATCEPDRRNLQHPIGTGPFRWVESPLASTLALARWERYWRTDARGAPLPYLDRVELTRVTEAGVALAALHDDPRSARALHVVIPGEALRSKLVDPSGVRPALVGDGTAGLALGTRTNEPDVGLWLLEPTRPGPLRDSLPLRRAIALAIDRDAAVGAGNRGASAPARPYGRFLQPAVLGYDRAVAPLARDLAAARRELAGIAAPPALVIGYSHDRAAAEAVVASLVELGLTVRLEEVALRDQSSVLATGEGVDAMLVSRWGKLLGDELISIAAYDQTRSPAFRAALATLAGTRRRSERAAAYAMLERVLLAELPSIPIATLDPQRLTFAVIVRPEVEGLVDRASGFVPHDDELTFAEVYLR